MPAEIPSALVIPVVIALCTVIGVLWRDRGGAFWREMWDAQVKRTAQAAATPRKDSDPPPASLPPPDWKEDSKVMRIRDQAEIAALRAEIERYERDMAAIERRQSQNDITPVDNPRRPRRL